MTDESPAGGGVVTVERLNCTYLVGRDHPAPAAACARLDALVRHELAGCCRALLPAVLDPGDPSVWFARRIDVDVGLDLSAAGDDLIARRWGERIVARLAGIVEAGPHGDEVVRFADRAEYLASFARDLTRGSAWERWYYTAFAGLRSLPAGRAIAEALAREPALAGEALLRLDRRGELGEVLAALSPGDMEAVWSRCLQPREDTAPSRRALDAVLAVWPAVRAGEGHAAGADTAIRLYVALRRASAPGSAPDIPAAIGLLVRFARLLGAARHREALADALTGGNFAAAASLIREAAPDGAAVLTGLIEASAGDVAWVAAAARIAAPPAAPADSTGRLAAGSPDPAMTAFGGLFLLLPVMIDLQIDRMVRNMAPPGGGEDRAGLLLHLLLTACLGRQRAIAAALDPEVARMSGLERPPTLEALAEAAAGITPAAGEECMRFVAGGQARRGRVDGACLAADLVSLPSGDVLLLRDTARDVWLYAAPADEECGPALRRGLALATDAADIRPACVQAGDDLDRRLGGRTPEGIPSETTWLRPGSPAPVGVRARLAEYRDRVRPARDDLLYLSLAGLHPLNVPAGVADLALCLAARAVLRELAVRLMGFEWSSCAFLERNFLIGISTVRHGDGEVGGGEVWVDLARPPLHVILSLTGLGGQAYEVPWLNGTRVTVRLADG